jgi:hypothetical protein
MRRPIEFNCRDGAPVLDLESCETWPESLRAALEPMNLGRADDVLAGENILGFHWTELLPHEPHNLPKQIV